MDSSLVKISLRLKKVTLEKLKAKSSRTGVPYNEMIRRMVESFIKEDRDSEKSDEEGFVVEEAK